MDELDELYFEILDPTELVKHFTSSKDFREWLEDEQASLLDLQECLKVFESHELYEHCAIIKSVIDDKL